MTQNKSDNWVRFFQVDSPRKHRNGFTIYKVTSVVFPKNAPEAKTDIIVWKRYNDFKKLHNSLKIHHKNCNITEPLPILCKAKYFKRFEEDIIRDRIKCVLDLLNFIGRHPPLFTCVPFLQFFHNSYQVSDTVSSYNIDTLNDNGNESYSTNFNSNFEDKNQLNGVVNNKENTFEDELIDSDNSLLHSSEDESISVSEGGDTPPVDSLKEKNVESDIKKRKSDFDQDMAKSVMSLPDHFQETVTCRSEEPVQDSEMWVCVESQAHHSNSHSIQPSEDFCSKALFATEDYLVAAGYNIGQAQKCEVGGEYEAAFAFYKSAMACLLSGISGDECIERRIAVQEKIKRYAQRAENVYALHLSKKRHDEKEIISCSEGLKVYKVVSIIDKVLLVLNIEENKKYVIKVLEKSPCPVDLKRKTIIPYNVPYMVKLVKFFENENSIFLILQYASGGKLWDYVDRCFRDSVSVGHERDFVEYRAVEEDRELEVKQEKSYFELLKDYTTYTAKKVFGYYECDSIEKDATDPVADEEYLNTESVLGEENHSVNRNGENEVTHLVENSQKLLASIKQTLQQSELVTDKLTKNISDIESALDLGTPETEGKQVLDSISKKRSKSVARSKFERRFSSEDVLESKSRTASSSLDRSGQWSRLAAMLESAPVLSETTIREWAAEMFVALETLHRWGVTCQDLHPGNILLDENGHLLLTFQLYWRGVDSSLSEEAITGLYAAPETTKIFPVTPAADWWSYGALLFQLLTGKSLSSCYPGGIFSHTIITFPEFLSAEACSLLTELLRYDPTERLGGGVNGSDDIKCHPFFSSIDWQLVYEYF